MCATRSILKNVLFAFLMLAVLFSGSYRPALAASESQNVVCKTYHTVQRGEYLSQIARQYNVSWVWLAEINELDNASRIFPGQRLCVELQPGSPTPTPTPTPAPGGTCKTYHTVARGEYLSLIAKQYGVSWRWLAEINKLADPSKIITGQRLCVELSTEPTCTQYHTVARGEYLVKIARQYNTTWRYIAEINNLKDPTRIYAGNRLCVAMSGTTAPKPPTGGLIPSITITGVVKDGTVTVQTKNFPASDSFVVLMDKMGTRAVNGIQVGTFNSGTGGSQQAVFTIPEALRGQKEIAIRLESRTSGYFAYNWFTNSTWP
jgi:LysM repeat protein